jgi:hypothetical protein
MHDLYSEQDLALVSGQLKKRLTVLFAVCAVLLAGFIWSFIARIEPLSIALVMLIGVVLIFGLEMFCRPLHAYRKLVDTALHGRSHEALLTYDHLEEELSMVDGVSCRSLIFLGDPDKHGTRDQLFYWDQQKHVPAFEAGRPVRLRYTGKMIIGYE